MRRENKLALIVGFSVLLVVAVLVSDHLSKARQDEVADGLDTLAPIPDARAFMDAPLSDRGRVGEPARAEARPESPTGSRIATRIEAAPERIEVQETPDARRIQASVPVTPPTDLARGPVEIDNGPGASQPGERIARGEEENLFDAPIGLLKKWLNEEPGDRVILAQPGSTSSGGGEPVRTETPRRGGKVPGAAKYTIRPGDTLFEICEEFLGDGTRWREVAAMNPGRVGEDGKVFVNVTIDLPQGARTTPAPAPKTREATRGTSGGTRSYVVKNGDTLSEVVMREVGSVRFLDRVRALNPWLKDQNDNIRVGQTLTLPGARRALAR